MWGGWQRAAHGGPGERGLEVCVGGWEEEGCGEWGGWRGLAAGGRAGRREGDRHRREEGQWGGEGEGGMLRVEGGAEVGGEGGRGCVLGRQIHQIWRRNEGGRR